jgi:ribose transport system permease protein
MAIAWRTPLWVLPSGIWITLGLAVLVAIILHLTVFGRYTFAIGSNEATARLCGVPVDRCKVGLYTLGGALTGISGVLLYGQLTIGDPTVAVGKELDIIAATVIGGGSLSGGEGSVLGSLIGAFIMSLLRSGCTKMEWPNPVQEIVIGVIIILAVSLDRLRHRRAGS